MSGSYSDYRTYPDNLIRGSDYVFLSTGTNINLIANDYGKISAASIDLEELWEKMYARPKPVIIVCAACKSHNAVTNPTCVQCGYPMGLGEQRIFA